MQFCTPPQPPLPSLALWAQNKPSEKLCILSEYISPGTPQFSATERVMIPVCWLKLEESCNFYFTVCSRGRATMPKQSWLGQIDVATFGSCGWQKMYGRSDSKFPYFDSLILTYNLYFYGMDPHHSRCTTSFPYFALSGCRLICSGNDLFSKLYLIYMQYFTSQTNKQTKKKCFFFS